MAKQTKSQTKKGSSAVLMKNGGRLRNETQETANRAEKACVVQWLANTQQAQPGNEKLQLE
jgi:hypothetical protein